MNIPGANTPSGELLLVPRIMTAPGPLSPGCPVIVLPCPAAGYATLNLPTTTSFHPGVGLEAEAPEHDIGSTPDEEQSSRDPGGKRARQGEREQRLDDAAHQDPCGDGEVVSQHLYDVRWALSGWAMHDKEHGGREEGVLPHQRQ